MTQTYIYNTLKNNFNDDTYNKLVKQFGKPDVDFMIMHTDLNPQKALELKEKRKDSSFRKNVLERFNRKCIITKNQEEECEIAHILPFCECNELQKYDVNNGLLLSANIHKLFDKYIFSINPFTFSIEVKKDKIYTISDYEGMKLNLHIENIPYLEKH
jgi:predicted restriction endonuclease